MSLYSKKLTKWLYSLAYPGVVGRILSCPLVSGNWCTYSFSQYSDTNLDISMKGFNSCNKGFKSADLKDIIQISLN